MAKFWNVAGNIAAVGVSVSGAFAFMWMFLVLGDNGPDATWTVAALICAGHVAFGMFSERMTEMYETRDARTRRIRNRR